MLVNGLPSVSISPQDRGFNYGDGVFRTLLVRQGRLQTWPRHYLKLQQDCDSLRLDCPVSETLLSDIALLTSSSPNAVIKIVITRGIGQRGYAISDANAATRIVSLNPLPPLQVQNCTTGIRLYRCLLKLGHQPRLAGIKHLNRLENVLAATECLEEGAPEGLLEDTDGYVISGTRSNLFVIRGEALYTPDLSRCGVAGVQRERVMDWAKVQGTRCKATPMRFEELLKADEIFMVNSVFGLWPVAEVGSYNRKEHPISWKIQEWLKNEND